MTTLLYSIPPYLDALIATQKAELVGAIIKDSVSGKILGHVQQSSWLQQAVNNLLGPAASGSFSPLGAISVFQNHQIKSAIAELQNGMLLMQNLQYGTLALSGLGLGVSIAGFAATLAKLNAIEKRLDVISEEISKNTKDRREDELKSIFARIGADIQNVETLLDRRNPQRVSEELQLSLSRAARQIEVHFLREADFTGLKSMPLAQLDRLWTLAAAIRLCQEASIQALFSADELKVVQSLGQSELERQLALLKTLSPDSLSRLIARGETDPAKALDLRQEALGQARTLRDGIKGGVLGLAGQISIAQTLEQKGASGIDYMRDLRQPTEATLLFLEPAETET